MMCATLLCLAVGAVTQAGGAQASVVKSLPALEVAVAGAPPVVRPVFASRRPAELVAVDCHGLSIDEQITLLCLQGLVNRKSPRLFLVGLNDFNRPADLFWLSRLRDDYGIANRQAGPWDALKEYAGELGGYIVYLPEQPWTENLAAMIGSLLGWLPVAPQVAARAQAAGLSRRADLSGLWPDRLSAYRWAEAHLLPKLGGTDFGTLPERGWLMIRDYLVMRGAFMSSLTCKPGPERDLKGDILSKLPQGSIQWGWLAGADEGTYTRQASSYGDRTICSTNSDNMSIFSQIRLRGAPFRQPPRRTIVPERKVYLAFVLSDGDAAPIDITQQWYHWKSTARGKVPFGWEIQPLLAKIAPVILEYYYETASPEDEFILGPSGAGYTNPSHMPNLDAFLRDTEEGLRATDSRVVGIIDDRTPAVERKFSAELPSAEGFFYGWGGTPTAEVSILGGKPHCDYRLCPPRPKGPKEAAYYADIARTVSEIAARDGLPCCIPVHLSCYWSGPSDVAKIVDAVRAYLPVEVVKPSELVELMRKVYANRIMLSAPASVEVVPGLRSALALNINSTRGKDSTVKLRARAAGVEVRLPAEAVVPREGSTTVDAWLSLPAGQGSDVGRRDVAVEARVGEATSRARVEVASVPAPEDIPTDAVALQSTWEAENLNHNYGHEEADPAALDGKAWAMRQGQDEGDGCAIWGPYEPLQPGDYAVAFRLRSAAAEEQAGVPIADLDVFDYAATREGGQGELAQKTLVAEPGGYRDVWLRFTVKQPLKAEYRVSWRGAGGVWVDRVLVVRLRGAKP